MKLKLPAYFVYALILFGVVFTAEAQTVSTDILVEMTPQSPAPHENTTITLKSYVENLDSTLITWLVDGNKASSGIGKKTFSVTAPKAGAEVVVSAVLALPGGTIEKKISVKPASMVLLWQATDSYVPPFYRGKALPTPDSEVKVVAMPEVKSGESNITPRSMVYKWARDYNNYTDGSGYGKNYFLYINDYLDRSNNVSVEASTVDREYTLSANIDIGMTEPKILFYKNAPNIGTMYQRALSNTHSIQGAETIEAVPYFISPKQLINPTLVWKWFINGNRASVDRLKENLMSLQTEEGAHGEARIRLEITNTNKIFQNPNKEINITF